MNREIEFRGKRLDNGDWLHGDLIHDNYQGCYIYPNDCTGLYKENEVDPDTVGQFTGMKDKHGKKIFEGDILLWTRKSVHIEGCPIQDFSDKCVIYYDNDKCGFRFRCKLDCGSCIGNLDFSDDRAKESYIEIIGNIYDNPELLEKE